ncbi:MAG: Excinuclease ABC, C subunit-like [Nitrospira sp.]|jgi:predicted GIY-YIG superfamily endonuclease|nr:MAG: Excinuclease ABC, C subunit-like [Nitrospira sp.]
MGVDTVTKQPAVYILASRRNGTLYVGVTSNLVKRVWEHKQNVVAGLPGRTRCTILCTLSSMRTCAKPSSARSKSRSGIVHGKLS